MSLVITKVEGADIDVWAIRLRVHTRIMGHVSSIYHRIDSRIWAGDKEDWCGYVTHAKSERWAKILARAWSSYLNAANKAGALTLSLKEYENTYSFFQVKTQQKGIT